MTGWPVKPTPAEAWVLAGADYSLPFRAEWPDGAEIAMADFHPDVPMTRGMKTALAGALAKVATRPGPPWPIQRVDLVKVAWLLEPGKDPQDELAWTKPIADRPVALKMYMRGLQGGEKTVSDQLFIAELARTGFVGDYDRAALTWAVVCRHMLNWLVNWREPVDLGFCEITPVPFRANWKELLIGMRHLHIGIEGDIHGTNYVPAASQFTTADPTRQLVIWGLEMRATKPWWQAAILSERRRRGKRSDDAYAKHLTIWIRSHQEPLMAAYRAWLAQKRRPAGKFFARLRGRRHLHAWKVEDGPENLGWVNLGPLASRRRRVPEGVESPDALLPRLRDVRFGQKDLRNTGGKVVQPAHQPAGTEGVPMLVPGQSQGAVG